MQVEQGGGVLGVLKNVGRGLVDGDGARTGVGIGPLAGVQRTRRESERVLGVESVGRNFGRANGVGHDWGSCRTGVLAGLIGSLRTRLQMGGHPTYGVTYSFALFGQKFRANMLFVGTEDTELCFTLSCHESDFVELQKKFRSSLFGWQWQ